MLGWTVDLARLISPAAEGNVRGGNTIQQDKGKSEGERGRKLSFAHEF